MSNKTTNRLDRFTQQVNESLWLVRGKKNYIDGVS